MADLSPQLLKRDLPFKAVLYAAEPKKEWISIGRIPQLSDFSGFPDERVAEITGWLDQPEQAGQYNMAPFSYDVKARRWVAKFFFSHNNTALAFKLRFG